MLVVTVYVASISLYPDFILCHNLGQYISVYKSSRQFHCLPRSHGKHCSGLLLWTIRLVAKKNLVWLWEGHCKVKFNCKTIAPVGCSQTEVISIPTIERASTIQFTYMKVLVAPQPRPEAIKILRTQSLVLP